MSINVINNNESTSSIKLDNTSNLTLNISNNGKVNSSIEVIKGNNNNIKIDNNGKTLENDFSIFPILLIVIALFSIIYLITKAELKKIKKVEEIKNEEIEDTLFKDRKKEIEYILSLKIKSEALKSRIIKTVMLLEESYNKNMEIIKNLKYKEKTINGLTETNKNILNKLDEIIDAMDIENKEVILTEQIDDVIRYLNIIDEENKKRENSIDIL